MDYKTLNEIIATHPAEEAVAALKEKSVVVPAWDSLEREYDPNRHPVMDKARYPDIAHDNGTYEEVTRITYDLQRLATKRMTEMCNGIPVKRIYDPQNERQKEVAAYLESIMQRNRINSMNVERCNMVFAGCEVMTLWFSVEQPNDLYGFHSPLKIRCANYSPMQGDELYPLFDEYGDMIAMSVGYRRKVAGDSVSFFDAYTADHHYKWTNKDGSWTLAEDEQFALGKIPAIYMYRPKPIWEDSSRIVYEMEWAMSRNGNYLRKNSKPLFVVFANEAIPFGREKSETEESRAVLQFPAGSNAQYVTWAQAVDNLKFYISELRQSFFTQLQLPDWNYEKMSQQALSGESRKQLFIDAQMKVKDEEGRLLEFFSREVNVVKTFLTAVLGAQYAADIEALPVSIEITPFSINDSKEQVEVLMTANGNKPIVSQRESVSLLGWSDDVDGTMQELNAESMRDVFEPTM